MVAEPNVRFVAGFEEPFVATGPSSSKDDKELTKAIAAYRRRLVPNSFESFNAFLNESPKTVWRTAVQTNLGFEYYRNGYFSRALEAWQLAWEAGRAAKEAHARALTDRAFGELIRMHARLGHVEELVVLLREIDDRRISGQAKELVLRQRQGA